MIGKLNIRTRLLASYAMIVALMIITGVYSLNRLDYAASRTTELYDHPFTVRKSVRDATLYFIRMHSRLKEIVSLKDVSSLNTALKEMSDYEKGFNSNMEMVNERFLGKKSDVDDVLKVFGEWKQLRDQAIAAVRANKRDAAGQLIAGLDANQYVAFEKEMGDVLNFADNKAASFVKASQTAARESFILIMVLILASITLTVIIAVFLTRSITLPLYQAVAVAERVAGGDLTVAVPVSDSRDELTTLLQTFQRMVENLRAQTLAIQEGVNVLAAGQ